jgi:WD40 repeat protein
VTTATSPPPRAQPDSHQDVPECPYVGLVPFDEKDAAYFFGRERESDLIVANLTASRLTLLYATSGVGKSSVLRAGVLPQLHEIDDDSYDYDDLGVPGAAVAYVSAWRDDPLQTVATAVVEAVAQVTGVGAQREAASAPKFNVSWLRELLSRSGVPAVYLILDQFEEYFFYHPMDRGGEGLTAELGRILSTRALPVHVLLSIRDDAIAGLDRFKGRVPHLFDNYLRLTHLSRDAAQAAIEGPLRHYNRIMPPDHRMSIEPGLIETLLDQVRTGHVQVAPDGAAADGFAPNVRSPDGRGDIEAPFLQLVLIRLWEEERASGSSSLRQSTLDRLGGAQTIVQTHLDTVMAGLSPAQLDVAAAVFQHLITKSGTKIALPAEDLAEWADRPVNAVQELLETLCSGPQRILRAVSPPTGVDGPPRYEIFHDVMGDAVLGWRRHYEAELDKEEAARHLIAEREEARAAARTTRRQLRQALLAAGLVVVLLAVISVFAYARNRNAQQQASLTQAAAALSYNPAHSLEYAVDAYQVKGNQRARSAVLAAASSPRSRVVAEPAMIGMASTPDSRHMVAYDAHGNLRVIGDNGAVEREITVSGLPGTVTRNAWAAAVSPDASRIALGTDRGAVALIDATTGRHIDIETQGGLTPAVTWIGSAANGLVLIVSRSGVAATYSPDTGKQVARFPGAVYDAVPLADQQHIVTASEDKKLRVWDARSGAKIAESSTLNFNPTALRRYVRSVVSLSVVGLSVDVQPSIVVWNWQAGLNPVRYPVDDLSAVRQVVVNEHTQTVIIAKNKDVQIYSLATGSLLGSLPRQTDFVTDVAISPDGQWITTAGADGRVLVWFLGHGQFPTAPTYELLGHSGAVNQVSFQRAGQVVTSVGLDGTVRRWELPAVLRFEQPGSWVVNMDLSRDGTWLATASQDGHVFIIDRHNLSKPPVATVSDDTPLQAVLFDPKQPHRVFTLGRSDIAPKLWSWGVDGNVERLPKYQTPPLPTFGLLVSLAVSPDGKTIAAGDNGGSVHLWDTRTGTLRTDRALPGTGQPADSVTFDPTGQLLAATGRGGIRLWKWDTAERPIPLSHPHATNVTFDPSGDHLASTAGDGTVNVWTTRDGKLDRNDFVAHDRLSSGPSFSADGALLAIGTAGGQVEVWDVHSAETVMFDRHHSAPVNKVIFLPDDRSRLMSGSDDTTVAQFNCPACTDPDRVIREAAEWTKANP